MRMYDPPHPGAIIREWLGDVSITKAAAHLGVSRRTLQRVVDGSASVTADMAYRLAEAFGTSAEVWGGLQLQYDLYQAGKLVRPRVGKMPVGITNTFVPKGVYRFKSHEDQNRQEDEWLAIGMAKLARSRKEV